MHFCIGSDFGVTGADVRVGNCKYLLNQQTLFKEKSIADIENIVKKFIEEMVRRFYKDNADILEYLCCETNNIATRIYTANQYGELSKVFVL